jgi:glycosyltransferase involved in cell wall biosynthesis
MSSIVIPAYNEEKVIFRCLAPLLDAAAKKDIEIIVVCNGCTDSTAQIVSGLNGVKLIDTPVPSKANALNLGDKEVSGFPRFYLDADTVVSLDSIRKVAEVLNSGAVLAAAPQVNVHYSHSSWFVRSYYDVWLELPYVKEGMIGTGVYALSRQGRERFDKFPDIIADDGYVRALFKGNERTCVKDAVSEVWAPATISDMLKIFKRVRAGNIEIARKFPNLRGNEEKKYINAMMETARKKELLIKIPIYIYITILSKILAVRHLKKSGAVKWEKDESSRGRI